MALKAYHLGTTYSMLKCSCHMWDCGWEISIWWDCNVWVENTGLNPIVCVRMTSGGVGVGCLGLCWRVERSNGYHYGDGVRLEIWAVPKGPGWVSVPPPGWKLLLHTQCALGVNGPKEMLQAHWSRWHIPAVVRVCNGCSVRSCCLVPFVAIGKTVCKMHRCTFYFRIHSTFSFLIYWVSM